MRALFNTPGIFGRTEANTQMSLTVTNNNVDSNFVGAPEIRFDTNSTTVGDPVDTNHVFGYHRKHVPRRQRSH